MYGRDGRITTADQQIFKRMRRYTLSFGKMADVYICLKYIEKVFEIHPDQILKAIDVKLLREKGRLDD